MPRKPQSSQSAEPQADRAPRVSVIVPCYNHERFVARAIDSVLAQTYQDFEIVVTDDASTDGSAEVLRAYADRDPRITLFVNRFNYETHAANNCIQHARGDYVAVLHSDDEFLPTKLEKQVNFLDQHPNVAAVFALPHIVNEQGDDYPDAAHPYWTLFNQRNRSRHEWLKQFFFQLNCLLHLSVLIRREVYQTLGSYNPLLGAADDPDMWVRVCLRHEIHVLPEVLVNFRLRDWHANVSGARPDNVRRHEYEWIKILDHFQSPEALAQLHLIFPEVGDQVQHASDAVKRHVLAKLALSTSYLSHRFWAIDLLYRLQSDPETKRQLDREIGLPPESEFIRTTGSLSPFTVYQLPIAQVFWPVAGVYSEMNSQSVFCPQSHWGEVRIPVPTWDAALPLRLDPCNCAAVVRISEVNVLSRTDGTCLWKCDLNEGPDGVTVLGTALRLSDQHHLSILSTGTDPQIHLTGIPALPNVPLELQVRINVEAGVGGAQEEIEALRAVVAGRDQELESFAVQAELLGAAVAERERKLQGLATQLEGMTAVAAERDRELECVATQAGVLKVAVAEREVELQRLEAQLTTAMSVAAEREGEIESLSAQVDTLKAVGAEQVSQIQTFLNSRSWRYTSPLRRLRRVL